jgi:hypothetical protein
MEILYLTQVKPGVIMEYWYLKHDSTEYSHYLEQFFSPSTTFTRFQSKSDQVSGLMNMSVLHVFVFLSWMINSEENAFSETLIVHVRSNPWHANWLG